MCTSIAGVSRSSYRLNDCIQRANRCHAAVCPIGYPDAQPDGLRHAKDWNQRRQDQSASSMLGGMLAGFSRDGEGRIQTPPRNIALRDAPCTHDITRRPYRSICSTFSPVTVIAFTSITSRSLRPPSTTTKCTLSGGPSDGRLNSATPVQSG